MNKFISLAKLMDRRARIIQDPPSEKVFQQVKSEVICYMGGGERSMADINNTPQEAPVWFIPGLGYAPVRQTDNLDIFAS